MYVLPTGVMAVSYLLLLSCWNKTRTFISRAEGVPVYCFQFFKLLMVKDNNIKYKNKTRFNIYVMFLTKERLLIYFCFSLLSFSSGFTDH